MGIVTKKGDAGTTHTLSGKSISKADPCLNAVGTLDELASHLGLTRSLSKHRHLSDSIRTLQVELTFVGAELSCGDSSPADYKPVSENQVRSLEERILSIESQIKLPSQLILPGASTASSALDVARAVARRLEREVVAIKPTNRQLLIYLNRLSDYLFLLARQTEALDGVAPDTIKQGV